MCAKFNSKKAASIWTDRSLAGCLTLLAAAVLSAAVAKPGVVTACRAQGSGHSHSTIVSPRPPVLTEGHSSEPHRLAGALQRDGQEGLSSACSGFGSTSE